MIPSPVRRLPHFLPLFAPFRFKPPVWHVRHWSEAGEAHVVIRQCPSTCCHPFAFSQPLKDSQSSGSGQGGREVGSRTVQPVSSGADHGDGAGDLPVFLVSLCDGLGGALLACHQRTPNIQAHVVESDSALRNLVCHHFPHTATDSDVLTMDIDSLLSRIDSAHWELLLLIGGPPCQPFSHLGSNKMGFDGPRPGLLQAFIRVRDALRGRLNYRGGQQAVLLADGGSLLHERGPPRPHL